MTTSAPPVAPLVLAIETSCDDTACAVLAGDGRVLASAVSSQLAHRPYGGVVPEIASREHLANWPVVEARALAEAGVALTDVELVAATRGPGLVGALLVGLSYGKTLAWALGRPFHGVHHLEGHLYSPFLAAPGEPPAAVPERFVGLVVSGGHTALYRVAGGAVETVAETRDDAMGEVFDKLGKRLGLPYPQGPWVDRLAEAAPEPGTPPEVRPFAVARASDGSLAFSFSGLKSQAVLEADRLETAGIVPPPGAGDVAAGDATAWPPLLLDLLARFRAAAVAQVVDRLDRLWEAEAAAGAPFEVLAVSGGAAANRLLRREVVAWGERRGVAVRLVPLAYAGDNAAMIGFAALLRHRRGHADDPFATSAESRIPLVVP
jgi:N6-L-threonylcarbamoyladenine synthase